MPDFVKRAALIILLFVAVAVLIFSDYGNSDRVVRYDCRDAHWHPDVPVQVKKDCQKLMYEDWQKQQEIERRKKMI
jgi:hypothetical protein